MDKPPIATIESDFHIQQGVEWLRQHDHKLVPIIEAVEQVPLRRNPPGFASLAKIIVSQQVSVQSADAIWARLALLVEPMTPRQFMQNGEQAWIEAGLSRPKQRTLCALCEALADQSLQLNRLHTLPAQEAIDHMTRVKGIGPWTAEVYLLFAVGHPDIFPAGDLALQNAAHKAFAMPQRPSEKTLRGIAESWAPWRGVAARLFWAYYAKISQRNVMP